jgi:hypothetical protein
MFIIDVFAIKGLFNDVYSAYICILKLKFIFFVRMSSRRKTTPFPTQFPILLSKFWLLFGHKILLLLNLNNLENSKQ